MNHHTEESDGIAQLTTPLSSRFGVQIVQTLHDVSITNFTVTKVTLETGAPERRGTGVLYNDRMCYMLKSFSGYT